VKVTIIYLLCFKSKTTDPTKGRAYLSFMTWINETDYRSILKFFAHLELGIAFWIILLNSEDLNAQCQILRGKISKLEKCIHRYESTLNQKHSAFENNPFCKLQLEEVLAMNKKLKLRYEKECQRLEKMK